MGDIHDVERPRLNDDLHQHPLRPTPHAVDPLDNLPRPLVGIGLEDTLAPPMTPENFVCMANERVFVMRDEWGEVVLELDPVVVRQDAHGNWWALAERMGVEQVLAARKQRGSGEADRFAVEQERPPCAYYKRVMTSFAGQTQGQEGLRQVGRVCTAQRSEAGEYLSLEATEVFACDFRMPRDFVSAERLKRFDDKVIAQSRKAEEKWDPEAAIEQSLEPKEI